MELLPHKTLSIHLIDENFLFTDDFRDKYSWKKKYRVSFYPSVDKFLSDIKGKPALYKGNNIIVLAINLARPDKNAATRQINMCAKLMPGVHIIDICHKKELDNGVATLRNDNVIHIVNNENTVLRIDNAIKWILAKINLEVKGRNYKIILYLFLTTLFISSAIFIFSRVS